MVRRQSCGESWRLAITVVPGYNLKSGGGGGPLEEWSLPQSGQGVQLTTL